MANKIRMAVIGMSFGRAHLQGMAKHKDVEIVAVCDVDEKLAIENAEQYSAKYYTDYKELLKDDEIDAVSIATPDFMHREMVTNALKSGKHVLCEKPLALTLDDCKAMINEGKKSDKIFMVGQICRYTPSFKVAKDIITAGEIGNIFFIESEYAHDYSSMTGTWRTREDRHVLIGGGCHAVDLIRWLAGDPVEVFGYSNHMMLPDWPTDDCTIGIMKFKNGTIGKVFCSSGCKRPGTQRTVVYGTKGTIVVDSKTPYITLYRTELDGKEQPFENHAYSVGVNIPVAVASHNIEKEIEDFVSSIQGNDRSKITAIEGAYTVSVCTSIIKSCASGRPEKVDYNF